MGFFPLYRDNLLTGPSYVSLSIPPIPSAILKSIGQDGNTSFLLPNIDYIKKVLNGDLGIADTALKNVIFQQINSPKAIIDLSVVKKYAEISGLKLENTPSISNLKLDSNVSNNKIDLKSNKNEATEINLKSIKNTTSQNNSNVKIPLDLDNSGSNSFDKYKKGKIFRIPKSDIKPPEELMGFKSLEMVTLKSIFETQKPYIEIAKIVLDSLGTIEDIMARVMPLASANPLTHKSKKPVVNSGSGKRPKAMGFGGGVEIKKSSSDLKNLSSDKKKFAGNGTSTNKSSSLSTKQKDDNIVDTNIDKTSPTNYDDPILRELSNKYKILNVQYSTGFYIPGTDYEYSYVELPPDSQILDNKLEEDQTEDDLYDKWKPKNLIFGIFDSNGLPVNPNEPLKTSGYSGNNKIEVTTPFKRVDWLIDNPKWKFKDGEWKWPILGEPNYVFTNGFLNKTSKTKPDDSDLLPPWKLKKYKEGDKNLINKQDAMPGDPVIESFDSIDKVVFQNYFREYTELSFRGVDLSKEEKIDAIKTITTNLEIDSHLENLSRYGQNKSSVYDSTFPDALKKSFTPYKIYVPESKKDPKLLDQNGMIWIDPESDYDMKIIKVIPVKKLNNKSELNYNYNIKTYIKNVLNIGLSDGSNFNIDFYKNSTLQESLSGVDNYILENWNISGDKIDNTNDFRIDIWNQNPIRKYKSLTNFSWYDSKNLETSTIKKLGDKWQYVSGTQNLTGYRKLDDDYTYVYVKNGIIEKWYYLYDTNLSQKETGNFRLPQFSESKKIIIDVNSSNISNEIKTIPLYQIKTENNGYKVLDPSTLNNKFLSKEELYSKNSYSMGTKSNPQKLEYIERYQLTDLDTDVYYIIEGVKIEDKIDKSKKNVNGEDDSSWYRLPHAVGAFIPFIKLLIKIFSKLIPSINKFINLLSNPANFITDIISEKLSESFPFLSKESFDSFKNLSQKIKNRDQIIKDKGGIFYIEDIQKSLNPNLKNLTWSNSYGIKKSNINSPVLSSKKELLENKTIDNKILDNNKVDSKKSNSNLGTELNLNNSKQNNLNNQNSNNLNNQNSNNLNTQSIINKSNDSKNKLENLYDKRPPILKNNENFGDLAFLLDGKATIPFRVLNMQFNLGMELKMLNLLENKAPLKLIFDSNIKKNKKDNSSKGSDNLNKNVSDNLNKNVSGGGSLPPTVSKNIDPKQYEIISVWYSTGKYIEGVDYEYSYITTEEQILLDEVDELIKNENVEELELAKDKLNNQLLKNKNNQAIKNKLNIVNSLLELLRGETQPILKLVLSLITTPLTIIGDIVKWIMDFFKSLTNPIKLPAKIAEFLSFSWILDFFTPKGIMEIMGIKFKPELLPTWIAIASSGGLDSDKKSLIDSKLGNLSEKIEKPKIDLKKIEIEKPDINSKLGSEIKLNNKSSNIAPNNIKNINTSNINNLNQNLDSNLNKINGDFEFADLSKFFSAPFMPKLPTYTLDNFKQKIMVGDPLFPLTIIKPGFCFIEKIINGFIDFIWSLMGIEPLIKPPHIKLCPDTTKSEDIQKILNGELPKTGEKSNDVQVISTDPYVEKIATDRLIYQVKMPNGEIKEFIDREGLDKFIEDNSDINFEFDF